MSPARDPRTAARTNLPEMLEEIGNVSRVSARYIANCAKDKNDGFKLMGFGHRVYKNFDPRAS